MQIVTLVIIYKLLSKIISFAKTLVHGVKLNPINSF